MIRLNRGPRSGPQGATRLLLFLVFTGVLLLPPVARADSRADAKRHFRDGMALIAAGQVERGISELKQAYAIKPHPDVLYDIAKAYVDLGNIPEALNYFQKYVATDPEDREQVEKVIARLSNAIGSPAQAVAQPAAAQQNVDVQKLIAQLQALIQQQQQAQQPAAAPAVAKNGKGGRQAAPAAAVTPQPPPKKPAEEDMFEPETISARSKATAAEIARELHASGGERDEELFEEQVVTAGTRSSESRAPASMTVITDEEIRLSGATTLAEVLRRVPGVDVAEMNPSDTNISFRGFNRRLSNKVLVLVDGRSVYSDYLGNTMWPLVDVALPDIQRIEVVRGPGSALYGANAFTGVVNIITKIGPEAGVRVFAQGGTHDTYQGGVSAGGKTGALTYRTTVAYDRADKWTKDVADGRVDMVPQFSQTNRSRENERADISAVYDLGNKQQLQFGGGFDNVALEVYPIAALRTFASEGQTGFARAELDIGQTQLKAFWNALRFNSGPEYWPAGIPSLNSKVRSDMLDASMQTAFDFNAAGKHRVTVGAGYRYKTVDWGYLATVNGSTRYGEHHLNAFLQEEWSPNRAWTIIASYRVDRHPLLASEHVTPGGLIHSPRGTILWEPKLDHVFRLTAGSAFRAPTFLESYTDLYAPIPNQPAVGVRFQGDPQLKPEEILQAELGYRGRFGSFQPEIVLYGERTKNLIVDSDLRTPTSPQEAVDPVTGQYLAGYAGFQNDPTTYLGVGAEIGGKWTPADGVDISVNYSYEKMFGCQPGGGLQGCTSDTTAQNQISATIANTAQHKANLTALWRTKANFDFGVDVHFVSSVTWVEKSFAQTANGQMGVLFNQYALDAYTLLNGRIGYRFNHDRFETGLSFYNLLESDDTAHREHPFGNRIGRRVMLSAMGTF